MDLSKLVSIKKTAKLKPTKEKIAPEAPPTPKSKPAFPTKAY